jgi:hypothetical protein
LSTAKQHGPVGVGYIGTGMISNAYLGESERFPNIDGVILEDLDVDVARARAEWAYCATSSLIESLTPVFVGSR